jgi:hypothetical protein
MPTKITVNYPQPITVKVDPGNKDTVVRSSSVFVGSANNFLPNTGGTISGNLVVQNNLITYGNTQLQGNVIVHNVFPAEDKVYNLGSPTLRFKTLYLTGNTIDLDGGTISASGDTITISSPTGGTFFVQAPANTIIDGAAGERAETTANSAYEQANVATLYSVTSYYYSDQAVQTAQIAYDSANTAFTTAVSASDLANVASETANIAYNAVIEIIANSNTIVRTAGADLTGTLRFATDPTASLTLGPVESTYGLDVFSNYNGYSQLNYGNVHYTYVNSSGVTLQTPNNNITLNDPDGIVGISSQNLFSIVVNGIEAISVYANNDIFLNGTIYGAPTALDGGDF